MKALYKLAKAFEREAEDFLIGKGSFNYCNCIVSYNIGERSSSVEVYNPSKDTYLDRIAEYLEGLIEPREQEYDEWDDHGFADEVDYWKWKL